MKNTLAIILFILGALLLYSGYKGETFANTIKILTGQEPTRLVGTPGNLGTPDDWEKNEEYRRQFPDKYNPDGTEKEPGTVPATVPGGELNPNAPKAL